MTRLSLATLLSPLLLATVGIAARVQGEDWPRFRGPDGQGQAAALNISSEWNDDDYLWDVKLPGIGHSSPVVNQGKLYITSGDIATGGITAECYNAATGQREWSKSFEGSPFQMHTLNNYAASTPAVDENRIYLTWASGKQVTLLALDHEGEEVWRRDFAAFRGEHGFSASPMVCGGVVVLQLDEAEKGYIAGFDVASGNTKWQHDRRLAKEAYSTPAVMKLVDGREVIVATSAASGIEVIDPRTGERVWQKADAFPVRTVGSPVVAGNIIVATCGSGGNGVQLVAVRQKSDGSWEDLYTQTRDVPFVPTPVVKDNLLFLWHERGTVKCVDLETGEPRWSQRVGGKYYGSPVCVGDRIVTLSAQGEAVILRASGDYELMARNDLGEPSQATVAVADGRMYLRTESRLMCLAEGSKVTKAE